MAAPPAACRVRERRKRSDQREHGAPIAADADSAQLRRTDPDTRNYAPGPRPLELGSARVGHRDLIGAALPRIEELRDKVGETIYRAICSNGDNVEICTAAGCQGVRVGFRAGHHEPAHRATTENVQLEFLSEPGLERFVERGPLVDRAAKCIVGKAALGEDPERDGPRIACALGLSNGR